MRLLLPWIKPRQQPKWGNFGVKKEHPVLLPYFCSQEPPALPLNSSTPRATLATAGKWCRDVAPAQIHDSSLSLLLTHSVENNSNCNSKSLWSNRLTSMKKLFPRKERVRGSVQRLMVRNSDPGCIAGTEWTAFAHSGPSARRLSPLSGNKERAREKSSCAMMSVLFYSTHWWQSQSWESTVGIPCSHGKDNQKLKHKPASTLPSPSK